MMRSFALSVCLLVALAYCVQAQSNTRLGTDRGLAPQVRAAPAKARFESLAQPKRAVISVRAANSLNARLLEDCLASELLGVGIDVVSRPKAERVAFELGQEAAKEIKQVEATGATSTGTDKPALPVEKRDDKNKPAPAPALKYRGLTELAKRAGADLLCEATLLQEVTPQAQTGETADPEKGLKTCLTLVVVDVNTEEIIWAGSLSYERLVSLPQIARDTIAALQAGRPKK